MGGGTNNTVFSNFQADYYQLYKVVVRKRKIPFFLLSERMLQSLKTHRMFGFRDPGGEQLAGCLALRAYLSESLGPEAPFRL